MFIDDFKEVLRPIEAQSKASMKVFLENRDELDMVEAGYGEVTNKFVLLANKLFVEFGACDSAKVYYESRWSRFVMEFMYNGSSIGKAMFRNSFGVTDSGPKMRWIRVS